MPATRSPCQAVQAVMPGRRSPEMSSAKTAPTTAHWKAAMHVLRYLAGTRELGITYGGVGGGIGLIGYCDADYAGDLVGRRSTSGFAFIFCNGAVSWGVTPQSQSAETALFNTTKPLVPGADRPSQAIPSRNILGLCM